MKLRTMLAGAAGAVGATALANRAIAGSVDELDPGIYGAQHTYRWRGMDIEYTELGDADDPDLVLFHGVGAGASSREFAEIAPALAEEYHVIAPDLPGFGRSDRPPLMYSASLYEGFVTDFLRDMTDEPIVLASSLSGSYAVQAARDVDLSRLVLICPTDESMPGRRVWLRSLLRAPLVGPAIRNAVTSKAGIRHFGADHGFFDENNITDEYVEYRWQASHQPGARYAMASFISGFLDPEASMEEHLGAIDVPTTLVWGRESETTPLSEGRVLADRADARLVVVDYAKLQPHVEHPDAVLTLLSDDLSLAQTD
ncbi:Pimeloyl-ACP methyl ester carboxylesterase [Natronoarchaeum philippinense]|uniref:Pimeloyl-ACP methyl ester carboxylesterase n=1 Tax=Natronoarchaeum philippinense TaxID=558529 RepID=A0A285N0I2_NATPI|nr:alpha/beta hydrolase [Natronoarchaeum philippinense]SNZ02964.1 Pimeloyl-ACP methyl ester carboxylesterase [Natronoarchaeum philippinense]